MITELIRGMTMDLVKEVNVTASDLDKRIKVLETGIEALKKVGITLREFSTDLIGIDHGVVDSPSRPLIGILAGKKAINAKIKNDRLFVVDAPVNKKATGMTKGPVWPKAKRKKRDPVVKTITDKLYGKKKRKYTKKSKWWGKKKKK